MNPSSLALLGCGIAFAVTVLTTPIARRVALLLRILDHPRTGKVHEVAVPYLGGVSILAGFLVSVFVTGTWRELGGVTAAVGVLAVVGLIDDVRNVSALVRLILHILAAAIAMATGVLAAPTNLDVLNVAITLLWLVGITNSFNLLDNMNGLSAGVALIAAAFLYLIAAGEGQSAIAVLAAATGGAALGFLPYNFPRARIFMGDVGSVPLGFLLAVIALKVRFPVSQPWSFTAPVCVLWIAVVDTTVVVADRLRSGRPIAVGGTDHLSHRLVAWGMSSTAAVALLLSVSAVVGLVGLLGGGGILPPSAMLLAWFASGAGVYLLLRMGAALTEQSHGTTMPMTIRPDGPLDALTFTADQGSDQVRH